METMKEIKDQYLGKSTLRRKVYERRIQKFRNLDGFEMGKRLGLRLDDCIMVEEIMEERIINTLLNSYISAN